MYQKIFLNLRKSFLDFQDLRRGGALDLSPASRDLVDLVENGLSWISKICNVWYEKSFKSNVIISMIFMISADRRGDYVYLFFFIFLTVA